MQMIGVVLWSAEQESKAVVWCEDQGDLAFIGDGDPQAEGLGQLVAGDILEFDVKIDGDFRRVNNPILLKGYKSSDVAENLRSEAQRVEETKGKIVSFQSPAPKKLEPELISGIAI